LPLTCTLDIQKAYSGMRRWAHDRDSVHWAITRE